VRRIFCLRSRSVGNTLSVYAIAVSLAALYAAWSPLGHAAVGSLAVIDPVADAAPHAAPHFQDPQELERALLSTDAKLAAHLFWQFGCAPWNEDSTEVVKRAWETRDSAPANSATRDPDVRALMAKCLVERWSRFKPEEPGDAPIIAELRRAIASVNAEVVSAGAFGLTRVATAEDVQAIVAVPTRLPALGATMVSALTQVCRTDAADGIAKIRDEVTDARQRDSIDAMVESIHATRRTNCGFDANIVGSSVSAEDIEDFWVSNQGAEVPISAQEIDEVLRSSDKTLARKMLRQIRCLPSNSATIDVVRSAWLTRDSGPADLVTRDTPVRVNMAACLAEAGAASRATADPTIAAELRKAVKGRDAGDLAAGMEGLSRIATRADVQVIVDAARRWPPFAAFAVGDLSTTCAPGAVKGAVTIRSFTTSARGRDWMNGEIYVTERVREGICGGGGVGHSAR
jgi:hypothetical protein